MEIVCRSGKTSVTPGAASGYPQGKGVANVEGAGQRQVAPLQAGEKGVDLGQI